MDQRSMRSVVISGPQQIHIEKRSVPVPGVDEVMIRVEYVAICGSDQSRFWDTSGTSQEPVVFGHEFSGRIVSAPGDMGLEAGQGVAVAPLFNCGNCEFCRAGKENMCPNRRRFGVNVDGALQDFVCLPADRVFRLPVQLSLVEGALIEPLAVAYHAVCQAGPTVGGSALVLGAGAIGLLIAQTWQAMGNGTVAIIDINDKRVAVAEQLGIPIYKKDPAESNFHTIFEATGSADAFSKWLPALAPAGKVVIVSKLEDHVEIDWVNLLRKEGEIITSRYFTLADFENSLDLVATGKVLLKPLIGLIMPLHKLAENSGLEAMHLAKDAVRLVIHLQDQNEIVDE